MTEEERKQLCADLRASWFEEAADEIERLAAENKELQERLDRLDGVALGKPG